MLIRRWSTVIRNNSKRNHTINYFLKETDPHADKEGRTHTYTHTLFAHVTLVFYSVLTMVPMLVALGKDTRQQATAPSATSGMKFKTIREGTH